MIPRRPHTSLEKDGEVTTDLTFDDTFYECTNMTMQTLTGGFSVIHSVSRYVGESGEIGNAFILKQVWNLELGCI